MKSYINLILITVSTSVLFATCKKEGLPPDNSEELVPVSIEFDNIVGGQNLFLNVVNYTNTTGEQFNISLLQYFISNIKLRKTDGTEYTVNQDQIG